MQLSVLTQQEKVTNPMLIFHREVKDKSLKKSALQSITTISIALGRRRTRQQLIPYLGNIFVEETLQMQKIILKGLVQLLHPIYIGKKSHHCTIILELIMDILCVYSNKNIRQQAYICLQKVFAYIDVKKAQNTLIEALKRLNNEQNDQNIRQLVLRMIPYVYVGVNEQKQVQLLNILNTFKEKPSDHRILSQILTQFIKVMPPAPEAQIREIISILIKSQDRNIICNLIEPIILLTKISGEETTLEYLIEILKSNEALVICACLKKFLKLADVFQEQSLAILKEKIQKFDEQPQQIKNAVLQLLDQLPVSEEQMIKLTEPPDGLQLRTTLSETLCRVKDTQGLIKLFNSSDPTFQVKLFPKLPPIMQFHIQIVEKIMKSKSWRQKLNLLQNIEMRNKKGEDTYLLISKLIQSIGDKIACVRVAVGSLLKNIVVQHKISLQKIQSILVRSIKSDNWFQRQSIFRVLLQLVKQSKFHKESDKQIVILLMKMGESEKVVNIKDLVEQIKEQVKK